MVASESVASNYECDRFASAIVSVNNAWGARGYYAVWLGSYIHGLQVGMLAVQKLETEDNLTIFLFSSTVVSLLQIVYIASKLNLWTTIYMSLAI